MCYCWLPLLFLWTKKSVNSCADTEKSYVERNVCCHAFTLVNPLQLRSKGSFPFLDFKDKHCKKISYWWERKFSMIYFLKNAECKESFQSLLFPPLSLLILNLCVKLQPSHTVLSRKCRFTSQVLEAFPWSQKQGLSTHPAVYTGTALLSPSPLLTFDLKALASSCMFVCHT